ncbi:MAG: hypothetical protein OXI40_05715 [Chloroflexota bacterium]|nr:hypothetical protein [Chloroflexota bacterium]
MWRLIPLIRMTLRMFFYSAAVFTVAHGLIHILFVYKESGLSATEALGIMLNIASWSVTPALVLALPLPLVTALCFREIRRPLFYRFAMMSVALVATITVWANDYAALGHGLRLGGDVAGYAAAIIASNAVAVYVSVIVAGKYVRDASERRQRLEKS